MTETEDAGERQALGEITSLVNRMRRELRDASLDPIVTRARQVRERAVRLQTEATRRQQATEAQRDLERIAPAGYVTIPE